jgi:guanosine-3',5'-bis(diphosphate) 3'-pyrophosphohydrolase
MVTIDEICESVLERNPNANLDLLRRAYAYAAESHAGQFRKSGDPYLVHPMSVAKIIADFNLDVPSICAGILHDCVEDTTATPEDIRDKFGEEIQRIVEGVTKLGQIPWTTREERQAENFRKMLLAMARDIRVILVKLADRVHNMRTLQFMSRDKQERIARETREIYAPIANRLGIQWMKVELEDLAFKYLEPQDWENLHAQMEGTEAERGAYIRDVCAKLSEVLAENEINGQVSGRAKGYWSIHQKMKRTGRDLEQVYDIIAFRIITDSVRDCYGTLGTIHSNWTPVPGRFKDYIALPKPNLYQSLHTTVIGPGSERMEVQIRTQAMHRTAEEGIAAHWQYKEKSPIGSEDRKTFAWLHQLMEWQRDLKDPGRIHPDREDRSLRRGSLRLHAQGRRQGTAQGRHAHRLRLRRSLEDWRSLFRRAGQRHDGSASLPASQRRHHRHHHLAHAAAIEGLDQVRRHQSGADQDSPPPAQGATRAQPPSRARLDYQGSAQPSSLPGRGREGQAARQGGRGSAPRHRRGDLRSRRLRQAQPRGRGRGHLPAAAIPRRDVGQSSRSGGRSARTAQARAQALRRGRARAGRGGHRGSLRQVLQPGPGDAIVAFISRGRGVIVHTRQCPKAFNSGSRSQRRGQLGRGDRLLRPVAVEVISEDKPGILAALSKCFMEHGVNIAQAKCRATEDNRGLNTFQVTVSHVDQLRKVLRAIQGIDGVISATRL